MLGGLGIGADQAEHHVRVMCTRGPHFLAVHHELVTDDFGSGTQRGKIGARAGLGITLAPDFLGPQNFRQVARLLIVVAPRDERRADHSDAHCANQSRGPCADHFFVDDRLAHRIHRLSAVLARP